MKEYQLNELIDELEFEEVESLIESNDCFKDNPIVPIIIIYSRSKEFGKFAQIIAIVGMTQIILDILTKQKPKTGLEGNIV